MTKTNTIPVTTSDVKSGAPHGLLIEGDREGGGEAPAYRITSPTERVPQGEDRRGCMKKKARGSGFMLIELLVVIAIVGVLESVMLASFNTARQKARVAQTTAQVRELYKAMQMYLNDTNHLPRCRLDCTQATDPLLNANGVAGWSGPYLSSGVWNMEHQWGGHIGLDMIDVDEDGTDDAVIVLDDDAPGTSWEDNSGTIPVDALEAIDALLDDGNLATETPEATGRGFSARQTSS
ncbi:MAG: hypothetical protein KatS3mg100_526 [Candidatus Parcubacteria bacterium]|nr:MAG: hypothetical protein KatS3mg100_526 [Candidatus Parcubacteria bacterium]